jgi:hypothetical protein
VGCGQFLPSKYCKQGTYEQNIAIEGFSDGDGVEFRFVSISILAIGED